MKNTWLLATVLLLALTSIGLCSCTSGTTSEGGLPSGIKISLENQQEGIWVSGHGEVLDATDITILQLGISAQRTSVAEAQSEAAKAMDEVMAALKEGGITSKDIQTQ